MVTDGRRFPSDVNVPKPAVLIYVDIYVYSCHGYDGLMPNKTIYVSDADLPVFQRAHLTAQQLGIADRDHARLFNAIWRTAEFPYFDPATGRPRDPAPVIRDFARFYAKGGGVTEEAFARRAVSPELDEAVKRTEALVRAWRIPSTPSLVVAGRYLINLDEITSSADLAALTSFLVGLERTRLKSAAPAK